MNRQITETLAQMFYDTDIIAIRKGLLDIDFFRGFATPACFLEFANMAAPLLDDYATDALIAKQDSLAWVPACAVKLELPCVWLRNGDFLGLKKDCKRAIHCSLMSPSQEELDGLKKEYEQKNIELVATFSLLGLQNSVSEIRQLCLVTLEDVLLIYHQLHLISTEDLQRLGQLKQAQSIQ